jgi:ATP-dependent RNA helicase RhlE
MSFNNFGLSAELLRAIAEQGYTEPTPIQCQAIPIILEGSDVLAGSQTGTGKTASFTLPLLQNLIKKSREKNRLAIRSLILTPTRELAAQVEESVKTYSKFLPLKSAVVFGGVNINTQIRQLHQGVDILVATPGRLLDLVGQRAVDLSFVEILVLDEADRMLDMGFIHDIRRILTHLPKKRQNLLFSATFSDEIKKLASGLLTSPKMIQVAQTQATADGVSQTIHPVDSKRKRELLSFLINTQGWEQVLVFTRTKHGADRLSKQLINDGISAVAIHGNKTQGARTKALADFKQENVRVLVATDIAARGLDINQLPYVVNYDLPNVPEDYVHRIGRTGRAGNVGQAISLVCIDEHKLLHDIERLLKCQISKVIIPGYTPDPTIKAEPIINGRPMRDLRPSSRFSGRSKPAGSPPSNRRFTHSRTITSKA